MNLDSRDGAVACVLVGAVLLAAPWYLDRLAAAGLDPAVDPLAALGVLPAGVFPVAVGAGYLVAGVVALLLVGSEPLAAEPVGIVAQLPVIASALAGLTVLFLRAPTVSPESAVFTVAVASVSVAYVTGFDPKRPVKRWVIAALGTLLLPTLLLVGYRAYVDGTVRSLVVDTVGPVLGVLLVAAAVLGYPLFRLGRSFEVVVR